MTADQGPGDADGDSVDVPRTAVGIALGTFAGVAITDPGGTGPVGRVGLAAVAGGVGFLTVLALDRVDEFVPLPIERWR